MRCELTTKLFRSWSIHVGSDDRFQYNSRFPAELGTLRIHYIFIFGATSSLENGLISVWTKAAPQGFQRLGRRAQWLQIGIPFYDIPHKWTVFFLWTDWLVHRWAANKNKTTCQEFNFRPFFGILKKEINFRIVVYFWFWHITVQPHLLCSHILQSGY